MKTQALDSLCTINPEILDTSIPMDFEFRYLDISAVRKGWIDWSATHIWKFVDAPSRARRRLRPGDVLLCTVRPGLQAHARIQRDELLPVIGSTGFAVLRPNVSTDSGFIFHQLFSDDVAAQLRALETGSSYPAVNEGDVRRVLVFAPEAEERKHIAAILDTVDEAIAKTEAVIAKLKQVRAGLLHDLLTHGLDEDGELRDPESHPEQFIESNFGIMPKTWKVGAFRDFRSPDRPYLKTGPFGSSLKQEHWVPEGVPVVTIGSLGEGQFIRSELLYVSEETAHLLSAYALLPGDIVFSRVADVGRSVVVTDTERGWIMSSNMMWISLDQRIADPNYVQANIAANEVVRAQIRQLVNAAGRDVANAAVMNALLLPWAPFDEQQRIVAVFRNADSRLQAEQVELQKLRLLQQGLMSDLLTGRVRMPEEIMVAP